MNVWADAEPSLFTAPLGFPLRLFTLSFNWLTPLHPIKYIFSTFCLCCLGIGEIVKWFQTPVRFLWAACIYRDSNKSCTARMNRGPAAPGATVCGTIIFTFIQMDSGGARVKKERANRFSWKRSWKIRIGPSPSWPLEGVLLILTGCCDYCPVLWESCSTWKTDPGVDIWMSSGCSHASRLAVPSKPATSFLACKLRHLT